MCRTEEEEEEEDEEEEVPLVKAAAVQPEFESVSQVHW